MFVFQSGEFHGQSDATMACLTVIPHLYRSKRQKKECRGWSKGSCRPTTSLLMGNYRFRRYFRNCAVCYNASGPLERWEETVHLLEGVSEQTYSRCSVYFYRHNLCPHPLSPSLCSSPPYFSHQHNYDSTWKLISRIAVISFYPDGF